MTQKISLNKSVFSLFKFTLKKNLGFALIASILALLVSPFYMYGVITDYVNNYNKLIYNFGEIFMAFAVVMAIAVTAFLMVLLYINFGFLYKKSASDFYHALPLKRSELLLARFSGSFVAALIPMTLGYIGAFALTFLDFVSADRLLIVESFFYTAAMLLLLGLFTLIFIITAGGIFDSIISLLAVNVGIPIIALFVCGLCQTHLYGYTFSGDIESTVIAHTTPFGYALVRLVYNLGDYSTDPLFTWYRVVGTVAAIVALAVVLILLYNRRKSEKVDGSYAFKFVPEFIGLIIAALGSFLLGYIFSAEPDEVGFWIFGAIGAAIAAVVYSLIINRGFRKVKKALIVAAVSISALLITNFCIQLDFFGWELALPKQDSIEKAKVYVQGENIELENITFALELNTTIIKEHNSEEYFEKYPTDLFTFTYTLKNGKEVTRRYDVESPVAQELKLELINKELPRIILEEYNEFKKLNCTDWGISINILSGDTMEDKGGRLSPQRAEEIVNAYAKDLEQVGLDFFYSNRKMYYEKSNVRLGGKVPISEETIEGKPGEFNTYTSYHEFGLNVYDLDNMPNVKKVIDSLEVEIIKEKNIFGETEENRYLK